MQLGIAVIPETENDGESSPIRMPARFGQHCSIRYEEDLVH